MPFMFWAQGLANVFSLNGQIVNSLGIASCIQTLSLIVIFLFPLLLTLPLILYKVLKT